MVRAQPGTASALEGCNRQEGSDGIVYTTHRRRALAAWGTRRIAGSVLALALATALTTGISHASSYCRTDPTVALSNGVSVQLWADIQTDLSNVNGVAYVLHVPKGVTMTGITYDATGYLENVQIVADQSGTHYELTTNVDTGTQKVGVTANAIRRDGTTAAKTGTSGTAITLNWCT
jgi:hypothetical protein